MPTAFWATAAGYFGNNFLPARAGELVRTFMISSRSGLGNAYVLATALSERVADAGAGHDQRGRAADAAGAARMAGGRRPAVRDRSGCSARSASRSCRSANRWRGGDRARAAAARAASTLLAAMEHGLRGMRAFHDARRLTGFLALTVVIWCLDALGTVIGAAALGFASAAGGVPADRRLGLGSALPSTPGYVGIYQFVAVTVLTPFGSAAPTRSRTSWSRRR